MPFDQIKWGFEWIEDLFQRTGGIEGWEWDNYIMHEDGERDSENSNIGKAPEVDGITAEMSVEMTWWQNRCTKYMSSQKSGKVPDKWTGVVIGSLYWRKGGKDDWKL